MKTKQNGFALVESLLIILILAVVGGAGWYVLHTKNQPHKASNLKSASIPADSSAITSSDGSYTIEIPDGWNLNEETDDSWIFANKNADLNIKAGTPAGLDRNPSSVISEGTTLIMGMEPKGTSTTSVQTVLKDKTRQGLAIQYGFSENNGPDRHAVPHGSKVYNYLVEKGNAEFFVVYRILSNETDHHADIEKVVQSLSINK